MLKPRQMPPRKSMANFFLLALAFGIMAMFTLGVVWLILQLQSTRCTAGTFLSGSGQGAMVVQAVPIFLASIGFAFLAVNWLVYARRHGQPSYRQSQRSIRNFSLVV